MLLWPVSRIHGAGRCRPAAHRVAWQPRSSTCSETSGPRAAANRPRRLRSRPPEGSSSAVVAASILGMAASGSAEAARLAATLALLVGGCFVVARLLRLGWIADYFSRPVLVGYIHGVAAVLIIGQLGKVLGLDIQ